MQTAAGYRVVDGATRDFEQFSALTDGEQILGHVAKIVEISLTFVNNILDGPFLCDPLTAFINKCKVVAMHLLRGAIK
jgi:hypothetical protein